MWLLLFVLHTMSESSLRSVPVSTGLFAGLLFAAANILNIQQTSVYASLASAPQVSLPELVRKLPAYTEPYQREVSSAVIENASLQERNAVLPDLMSWLGDERPNVRSTALAFVCMIYSPSGSLQERSETRSLPLQYIPAVAARLRDPDPTVRRFALVALQPAEDTGIGMSEVATLVLPMLREPDILTEYPDPFSVESDKRLLAAMTPEQQAAFQARPRKIIRLPAEGVELFGLLAVAQRYDPSTSVEQAMIAFLDRKEQTKSSLAACLQTLALTSASERVNNEALRRVFEQKAMTVFLLQFVSDLQLNPADLSVQKQRLLALSNDQSAHPALRRSAKAVAACWTGHQTGHCKPSSKDVQQQLDTR